MKSKVLSRQQSRSRLSSADTPLPPANDPVVTQSPSSVACDDSDGASSDVSHVVDNSSNVTIVQLQDLLGNFTKNLESRFSDINNKIDNLSQDVHNRSLTAPTVVVGCSEPTLDRPSLAPYSDGLEGNLGGLAASEVPTGVDSPTQIEFGVFLARVRELEFQHGYLPDSFLTSLRGKVIYAADHSLFLSGNSIADSVRSYCLRVFDPKSPAPGSSCDGDKIIPFVCSLFCVPVPSPSVALGHSDVRSSRVLFASFPSSFSFPVISVSAVAFFRFFFSADSFSWVGHRFASRFGRFFCLLACRFLCCSCCFLFHSCCLPCLSVSIFLFRSSCRLACHFLVCLVGRFVCCWFVCFIWVFFA